MRLLIWHSPQCEAHSALLIFKNLFFYGGTADAWLLLKSYQKLTPFSPQRLASSYASKCHPILHYQLLRRSIKDFFSSFFYFFKKKPTSEPLMLLLTNSRILHSIQIHILRRWKQEWRHSFICSSMRIFSLSFSCITRRVYLEVYNRQTWNRSALKTSRQPPHGSKEFLCLLGAF